MRYEPSINVFTVFFSALVGLGLQNLLTQQEPDSFGPDRWPCFILAVLIFLRFLTGSANHLWFEYVWKPPADGGRRLLFRDLFSLTAFGVLALRICYTKSVTEFLFWTVFLVAAAAIWGLLDLALQVFMVTTPASNWASVWLVINVVQAISIFASQYVHDHWEVAVPYLGWSWSMMALILLSMVLLWWDFKHQLRVLEKGGFQHWGESPNKAPEQTRG
jgi:hypothetical protein